MFSSDATITDVDSSTITSLLMIVIEQPLGSEIVTPTVDGVTSTINDGVIEYSGEQSIEAYLDLLRSIQYVNTEDEPVPGSVHLLVQVFTTNSTSGGQAASNVAEVVIEVVPLNDNDPMFSEDSYSLSVDEKSPTGQVVGTVSATDADIYSESLITYEMESEEFDIHSTSGVITTTQILDAEMASSYQLMVIASDNDGVSPRISTVSVTISVLDLNDNSPVFNLTHYTATVTENAASGVTILTVSAIDDDIAPANNNITYELWTFGTDVGSGSGASPLTPLPPQLPFIIDSTSGEMRVAENAIVDYETVTEYALLVTATDSGEPPNTGSAEITVLVGDENDEFPVFTQTVYTGSVPDDATPGTPILTVVATDIDSADITYSIESTDYLEIDSLTGEVSLKRAVDFTITPSLTAVVIANDTGSPPRTGEATVSVVVVNVNNNPPVFSQDGYTVSITEGAELLVVVNATDADLDQITYISIEGFDDLFSLDATTGVISLSPGAELDYESQSLYVLTVAASDGVFTTDTSVTVEVEDANDNPPFFTSGRHVVIPESLAMGSVVTQATAEDADSGSNAEIEYSLLNGGEIFVIETDTGIIRLQSEIDFESERGPFELQVVAKNTAPPFLNSSITITIAVSDTNDNIPFLSISSSSLTYYENSPPLPIAPSLTITDADSSSHLLTSCDVTFVRDECLELQKVCGDCYLACGEELIFAQETVGNLDFEIETTTTEIAVRVFGNGTEAQYQAVLSSLTYFNQAPEPVLERRNISIQCRDQLHSSNVLDLTLDIFPVNDNPIRVESESQQLTFQEGDTSLIVGGLTLTDLDVSAKAAWLRVSLAGSRDLVREAVSVDTDSVSGGGVQVGQDIVINMTAFLQNYQVWP